MILSKIIGGKTFEIKYRWKVEGSFTGWTTYKKFKTKKRLQEEFNKISLKSNEFIEYKVA